MRTVADSKVGRMAIAIVLTVAAPAALVVLGSGAAADTPSPAAVMRLMPLGDSITDGYRVPGGYRYPLWTDLVADDGDAIDFVGSLHSGPPELLDPDHEGHSGWRIDQIRASVDTFLAAATPDVVLLHIGTNDIVQADDMANAPARLADLVSRICVDLPSVRLVVMSVVPRPGLDSVVNAYNAAIPGVVATAAATGCAATFFDMNHYLTAADMDFGVTHPTSCGFYKMATAIYPVVSSLYSAFEAAQPVSSSSAASSSATDSPTDAATASSSAAGPAVLEPAATTASPTPTPPATAATCPSSSPTSAAPTSPAPTSAAPTSAVPTSAVPTSPAPSSSAPPSPTASASGTHGSTGTYFKNTTFAGTPAFTRVDAGVNVSWGTGAPRSDFSVNSFSVRWTGHVVPPVTTTYTFTTQADGGLRLWVNGVQLVNDWNDKGVVTHTGTIALTKGHSYLIKVEYGEKAGNASVVLRWKGAVTVPSQVIPTADLLPT